MVDTMFCLECPRPVQAFHFIGILSGWKICLKMTMQTHASKKFHSCCLWAEQPCQDCTDGKEVAPPPSEGVELKINK